jgi:hypothetical protein
MATRITTARRNAAADSVVDAIDVGAPASTVEIRSGAQPASANDVDAGTLLATLSLPDPAFGAAAAGVATANAIAAVTGSAADTAGHFRVKNGDGTTVMDGSVTATGGGGDMELNTVTISVGVNVEVTAWTVTMPAG